MPKSGLVCSLGLTAWVLCCPAWMPMAQGEELTPGADCDVAGGAAETAAHIPIGLLRAIGRVESGRPDGVGGAVKPWPWTLDLSGQGHFYATRDEALTALQQAVAAGVRFIDVGCFQVNLFYHPDAFPSLAAALDPAANADYAARFLSSLRQRTGDWTTAVAWYHSAEAVRGAVYRAAVMARWGGQEGLPDPSAPDPFTVRIGGASARWEPVVWSPSPTSAAQPSPTEPEPGAMPRRSRSRMPQVITPMLAR